jgi:hypothetical protein
MPAEQRGALFGELLQRIRGRAHAARLRGPAVRAIAEASEGNLRAGREGKILLQP